MAWFKCSSSFLRSPAVYEIAHNGDMKSGLGYIRAMTFIWILTLSLENDGIRDCEDLYRFYGIPIKQASAVWNDCIEKGILCKIGNRYSAKLWMEENGLIGFTKDDKARKNTKRRANAELNNESTTPIVEGDELDMYKQRLASLASR